MIQVKATREGLVGRKSASGWVIDTVVHACALPSVHALGKHIRIRNPANGRTTIAEVLDVGPWNEHDDRYVYGIARPAAENGKDERGRITNGAGIDLSERVWFELQMKDNTDVEWEWL